VLVAHWVERDGGEELIEFADGLVSTDTIVTSLPAACAKIFDLCVCHPIVFAREISNVWPECIVRFTRAEATPALWFYFYVALFRTLQAGQMTYLKAFEDTLFGFLGISEGKE